MSLMPDTRVRALAAGRPEGEIDWVPTSYRRPIKRFVEAGALAWAQGLEDQRPSDFDWVATLELCSLVTGQAARWRRRQSTTSRPLQAVLTWENVANQPLYKIPPYRQAVSASREADLHLCLIDAARDHLLALDFDPARIRVVKPGVDTELFHPAVEPVEEPVAVFCSPLAPNKGIDRVLEAFRLVRREIPDARLLVAGRGPLEHLVQRDACRPDSGVELRGSLDTHGVADLLREGSVFVTAPRPTWKWSEQFGLAYLEAMASALPVVTTRCGSNEEAVPPPNDLVADDVQALAEALHAWLTQPAVRLEAGRANRRHVETHHELRRQCAAMGEAFASIEQQR